MNALPHYYTHLAPFAEVFAAGTPVLTYHHVGPRPPGVRLKGLYVSPGLFARQMAELRQAKFRAPHFDRCPEPVDEPTGQPTVFITFDDGFEDVFEHAMPALRDQQMCGIEFLVSDLLGKTNEWQRASGDVMERLMNPAQVREWVAAGLAIGSHTKTHPWLTHLSLAKAREEISGSKKALEDIFGIPVVHFCYPYGDWNEAISDMVMEAGYRTACTTRAGVNAPGDSPYSLRRFTARYRSRSLKNLWGLLP